ncbi:hypothetical protein GNI_072970 [Gregarina niphandrodes]|uniref:Sas10/Utp3/C1D family protein n=1 Tax=Gregarina niphandrodes TaxID=110365 RepID=A0A023B756_GRENI|nr:hypothetical protein GNI_072970 [Gregarina niphandrodes]EZG66989.1 hypothetical protein GNI_072970 [Gregarina niphandrodes]|eukprot:XP_011130376.1 hypothetical protein GNI_072970 [Gregarina niphandrodes]
MDFPPQCLAGIKECQAEITNKVPLILEGVHTALTAWLANYASIVKGLAECEITDDIVVADVRLTAESLHSSVQFLLSRLGFEDPLSEVVKDARELVFMYQEFLSVYNKVKNNLKSEIHPEAFVRDDSKGRVPGAQPRLDNFEEDDENNDSGLYKAPRHFATQLGVDEDIELEKQQKDRERLKRSEFVKALTEQYTSMPRIIDDGTDDLDNRTRKALANYQTKETYALDNYSMLDRKDQKEYNELKKKQSLASKGSYLHDVVNFVNDKPPTHPDRNKTRAKKSKGKRSVKKSPGKKHKRS